MRPEGRLLARSALAMLIPPFGRSATDDRDALAPADARSNAEPRGTGVDARPNTILIGRAGIADACARCRNRGGGDTANVERREPRDASLLDPDPGIVEHYGERIGLERGVGPAAEEAAMRAGRDDCSDMGGTDERSRVESP